MGLGLRVRLYGDLDDFEGFKGLGALGIYGFGVSGVQRAFRVAGMQDLQLQGCKDSGFQGFGA